ncbi:hypothetical protein [Pseudomonas sp. ENNP23]|uniref:hypothetical protein n=1 Tax=Pseudomonas sp. ENNP23 TaxID=1535636 RepID=UPI00084B1DB0|nr:hypothetical protein [Pseudomonas sp. ENNP23]OEC59483.1 hypothetical protein A9G05_11250 [Pseudomonas sp. ENNP23]
MSDVNRNKLRALAIECRDEIIRSYGWEGTIEEAGLLRRDQALLKELSPETVIKLLDEHDVLKAERDLVMAILEVRCARVAEAVSVPKELLERVAAILGSQGFSAWDELAAEVLLTTKTDGVV